MTREFSYKKLYKEKTGNSYTNWNEKKNNV